MRFVLLVALLLASCGSFQTPYYELAYRSPQMGVGTILAKATENQLRAESAFGRKLLQFSGRVKSIDVFEQFIERSGSLSSCNLAGCSNATRRPHTARLASVTLIDDSEPGTLICAFSEKRFDEAASLVRGTMTTLGGTISSITKSDDGPTINVIGCVVPHE